MKHCSKCMMPETAESLSFDGQGVCSVCKQIDYKKSDIDWPARERELDAILDRYRGKGQYDCIVPFSGGKDSTFTLWYLVTVKKLKCLAVRFDHGFLRQTVQDNTVSACRKLGVDLHHFTPNWQVVRKLMFESLRRRGDFCWHCHTGIFAYPMWVSVWQKIPLLVWGEPTGEYGSHYSYDEHEEVDEERFNRFTNLGINAEDMLGMLDSSVSDYPVTAEDLLPFTFPPLAELRKLRGRSILLGSYIPWDVRKQVDIIHRELNWQGAEVEGVPPEFNFEKIECYMQGVRDYLKYLKRGFGRTTHLTSIDIRNGRMTRDEAEKLVETYDGRRPASLDIFLDLLGIDEARLHALLEPLAVAPWAMPSAGEMSTKRANTAPCDFDDWRRMAKLYSKE